MLYRTVKKALLFVAVPLFCINNDFLLNAQTTSDSLHLSSTDTTTIRPDSVMVKPFPYRSVQHFFEKIDTTENIQRGESSFWYAILPHDSLLHYYHEDFADMLMQIAGTYLHDQGSYGKPISVAWSGLSNRHILILLDGMPLTEPDWGWSNLNYVSLETIDRIEVFRGNASVRYGAQAATGYINIVSRQADADKPLTSLKFRSVFDDFRDVGVFFGRNFGSRVQTYVGGSSRGTPGEQLAIGLSGGTLANFNSTRYSGKNIFFGGKVLIHENIALQIHRQIYTDRYDAYGRDRDPLKDEFDFSTRGAERKDERDDWQARLVVNNKTHMWTAEYQNTDIVRRSTGFTYRLVPRYYGVKNQTYRTRYAGDIGIWSPVVGAAYDRTSFDTLNTRFDTFRMTSLFTENTFRWASWTAVMGVRYDHHSVYDGGMTWTASVAYPIQKKLTLRADVGSTVVFPSLHDEMIHTTSLYSDAFADGYTRSYFFPKDSLSLLPVTRIRTISGTMAHRSSGRGLTVSATIYTNFIKDGTYYTPVHVHTDTERVVPKTKSSGRTWGFDVEASHPFSFTTWTLRQSVSQGDQVFRNGTPWYRASLTGYGEKMVFQNNMRLTGTITASYWNKPTGYTFQDAPTMYFVPTTSNRSGGFLFFARVSAYVGDLQIFYEAENIFRNRFELMDGYAVTPQQWRFGLVWKLYN